MKMSNIIILSLLSLGLVTSFSFIYSVKNEFKWVEFSEIEGSENLATKTIENIGEFHSIEVNDQIKVVITQGEDNSVEISAEDNLMDLVMVENNDGTLVIFREWRNNQNVKQNLPMIVKLSSSEYKSLEARNQSEIIADKSVTGEEIEVRLHDQTNLKGTLNYEKIDIRLSQQSNANLFGTTEQLIINMRDQSGLRANSLEAKDVDVRMRNQTNADVRANSSIKGSVSGSAELAIKGDPGVNQVHQSQMAKVRI